jgi:hypothetical protein
VLTSSLLFEAPRWQSEIRLSACGKSDSPRIGIAASFAAFLWNEQRRPTHIVEKNRRIAACDFFRFFSS